jgi:hypothetical protein
MPHRAYRSQITFDRLGGRLLASRHQRRVDAKLVKIRHCPATVIGSGSARGSHQSGRRTRGIGRLFALEAREEA